MDMITIPIHPERPNDRGAFHVALCHAKQLGDVMLILNSGDAWVQTHITMDVANQLAGALNVAVAMAAHAEDADEVTA